MGKISLGREAKKGKQTPVKLPPMQILKPLTETSTESGSPVNESKPPLKKYVSPLSLSWQRDVPIKDVKIVLGPSTKKSLETVASTCQDELIAAASTSSPTQAADKPNNLENSFRLSEGAFNISRICVSSTPVASSKRSSDDADLKKSDAGENKLEENLIATPVENSDASTIHKKKKKKSKKKKNVDEGSVVYEQNFTGDISCVITAEHVKKKEVISPGLRKGSEIETIDLDMTNDIVSEDIEVVGIKKLSKKPVEIVDLSATLDDVQSAPSGNDTIIVIDEDNPYVPQSTQFAANTVLKRRENGKKVKSLRLSNQNRLLKIQPHPGLMKKKERHRKRKPTPGSMVPSVGQDDICFLGTGISFRPPIPTASKSTNGNAVIQPAKSWPSSSAGSSTQNSLPTTSSQPSIYGSNFDNPNSNQPRTGLRPIVIDGSNVAMDHGKRDKVFSSKGIEICVNYFLKRGHKVYCFIPLYRKSDPFTKDRHILEALEDQGHLICTPSRYVGSNTIVPYDDRYIVQIAAELGGVIISRDNFRDLIAENPIFKETIQERTLMFTWVGDIIMFPNDPFGRRNVSLDRMLNF